MSLMFHLSLIENFRDSRDKWDIRDKWTKSNNAVQAHAANTRN
jgi:hypothetical protein